MTTTHSAQQAGSALLDAKALGAQFGCSSSSIYRRRSLGLPLPPAVKIGGTQVRWRQKDVDAWLEERLEVADD